jgi:xylulokinase
MSPTRPARPARAAGTTVLAVDLGTGGPKTALVSLSGEVIDVAHRRVEPRVSADGTGVSDPDAWWDAIVEGTRRLVDRHPAEIARLAAVAVTGQWGSTVPVDAAGRPVGDCMLWMDTRGGELARRALGGAVTVEGMAPHTALRWVVLTGGVPSTAGNDPFGHRLFIRHEQPDLYRATATFLEPLDLLNARFTGRIAASRLSMLLSWLTDNRRGGVDRYHPRLLRLAGVEPSKLPPLVPVRSVVGPVLPEVARELGLPAGIPVVTALPDLHTAALGSGTVGLHEPHLSISTSAWIGCHTAGKRTSLARQMATVPAALPGRYLLANNHETAGVCLEWLRDNVLLAADGLTHPGDASLRHLDAVAATAAPGSGGVLFAPWLNGERSPVADAQLRASFHGVSLATTRAELVRAVFEGVAHNNRWLLEAAEKVVRHPLPQLRVVGGGAQSEVWCQIHADVLGRPVQRVAEPLLASVRGAAFFAGLVLGLLEEGDIRARVAIDRTFEPDPAARRVHDVAHAEYVRLPRTQRRISHRLVAAARLAP